MRVTRQRGSPKRGDPRQVPRSPPLKHTTGDKLYLFYGSTYAVYRGIRHRRINYSQKSVSFVML